MGEFATEITERLRRAAEAVRRAEDADDDVGVQAHRSELDDLRRLARDHGVAVPDAC